MRGSFEADDDMFWAIFLKTKSICWPIKLIARYLWKSMISYGIKDKRIVDIIGETAWNISLLISVRGSSDM